VAIDDLHVDGKLSLGENIADLGGLNISLAALKKVLGNAPEVWNKKIDGFTPLQRFFLSWGKAWRGNIREKQLRLMVKTDVHAWARFRAIGPLINIDDFYQAFDVKPGQNMFRPEDQRARVW